MCGSSVCGGGPPLPGIHVRPIRRRTVAVGHSGVFFFGGRREATQKGSVQALLDATQAVRLQGIQSAQTEA